MSESRFDLEIEINKQKKTSIPLHRVRTPGWIYFRFIGFYSLKSKTNIAGCEPYRCQGKNGRHSQT